MHNRGFFKLNSALTMGPLAMPLAFFSLWVYVYLPNYFFSEWGVSLGVMGALMLIARLSDLVTDVWVGRLSDALLDRVSRRWQIALGAAALLPLSFWLVHPLGEGHSPGLLLGLLVGVFFVWTWMAVPYQALMADWVDELGEKLRLNAVKEVFAVLGVLLLLLWPVMMGLASDSPQLMRHLWLWLAGLLAVGVTALAFYPLKGARHQAGIGPASAKTPAFEWRAMVRFLRQSASFNALLWPYFVNQLANALPATLFVLFVTYALALPEAVGPLLLVYFAAGLVGLPGWLWLARRWGIERVWLASVGLAMIGFSGLLWLEPGDFWGFFAVCVVSGLSLGIDLAAPNSLQAQWIQQEEARLGQKFSGLVFGVWGFFTKLAFALAVGLALPILDWMGLDAQVQAGGPLSESALMSLWLLYGGLPILLKLLAFWLIASRVCR
jgi:Na+/melibiose symporter-like transporter